MFEKVELLQEWAADKSRSALQEYYDKIPGAPKRKRLRNKPTALAAIWKALASITPTQENAVFGPHNPAGKIHREPKVARERRKKRAAPAPRAGSKKARLIALMKRKSGVTAAELIERFGWAPHTCRGLISTMHSQGLVEVTTSKRAGKTVYRAV